MHFFSSDFVFSRAVTQLSCCLTQAETTHQKADSKREVRLKVNTCFHDDTTKVLLLLLKSPGTSLYTMSCKVLSDLWGKEKRTSVRSARAPKLFLISEAFREEKPSTLWQTSISCTHRAILWFEFQAVDNLVYNLSKAFLDILNQSLGTLAAQEKEEEVHDV